MSSVETERRMTLELPIREGGVVTTQALAIFSPSLTAIVD
jgi:hypothetical protein